LICSRPGAARRRRLLFISLTHDMRKNEDARSLYCQPERVMASRKVMKKMFSPFKHLKPRSARCSGGECVNLRPAIRRRSFRSSAIADRTPYLFMKH